MADLPNVTGLDDLKRTFDGIVGEARKRVLRKGASAGAKYMRDGVKAATPVGKKPTRKKGQRRPPGALKASAFYFYARRDSNAGQAVFDVTYRKKTGFYAPWVNAGHRIVPRKSKRNGGTLRSRRLSANRAVPPHPFFEQSVTAAAERTAQIMVDTMQSEVANIVRERAA